jgi:hypothetical protein
VSRVGGIPFLQEGEDVNATPLKPWQDPATTIPPDAPVGCQIYIIWGWDPWLRGQGDVPLWVGESARFWLLRAAEHATKYWHQDITRIECVRDETTGRARVWPTKAAVWEAERELTRRLQPVHSWEYNQDNPWVVRDGRGVHKPLPAVPAHWSAPARRAQAPAVVARPRQPMGRAGRLAWAAAGWLALAAAVAAVAAATAPPGQPVTVGDAAGVGAVVASAVYGAVWWLRAKMRAHRRRTSRKRR